MPGDVKVAVTRVLTPTATGTQDITISGFGTPKAAMFFVSRAEADGTPIADAVAGYGATDGTRQWSWSCFSDHGQASTDSRRVQGDTRCVQIITDVTIVRHAAFDSWITDGVRINWGSVATTQLELVVVLFGGADLSVRADTIDVPGTGAVDVTGPGFEPDLVIGASCGATSGTTATIQWIVGFGFAHNDRAGTVVQRCVFQRENTSVADGEPNSRLSTAYVGGQYQTAVDWGAALGTFDASGFTLTPSANAGGDDYHYLALRFDGVSGWVGTLDAPTGTGAWAVTAPGFRPQFVMLVQTMHTAVDTDVTDGKAGAVGIGVFDATAAYTQATAIEDASATTDTESVSDDQPVSLNDHAGADAFDASFTSFDATGWTLNFSAADGTVRKWVGLAIGEAGGGGSGGARRRRFLTAAGS